MMEKKELGKITDVKFGLGGYQEVMLGIHFTFDGDWGGVIDSRATWDAESIKWNERFKWTEKDRSKQYDEIMRYISKLLNEAKVSNIGELKGIPVEISFENRTIKEWRILTEVL